MQIEIGKRYRNKHTLAECVVRQKIFFNIQYYEDGDERYPKYCHYKRFRKHWEEVE